jgi:hypothetical protein
MYWAGGLQTSQEYQTPCKNVSLEGLENTRMLIETLYITLSRLKHNVEEVTPKVTLYSRNLEAGKWHCQRRLQHTRYVLASA